MELMWIRAEIDGERVDEDGVEVIAGGVTKLSAAWGEIWVEEVKQGLELFWVCMMMN